MCALNRAYISETDKKLYWKIVNLLKFLTTAVDSIFQQNKNKLSLHTLA